MMADNRGRRPRLLPVVVAGLLCACFLCGESPAGESDGDGFAFGLPPYAAADIDAAGVISIRDIIDDTLLLECESMPPARYGRPDSEGSLFFGSYAEGSPCGHRGFSVSADDDGDGLVDEDRADGRDNDGDGLVDEDFAAIGDGMAVCDRIRGGRARHLEAYHWEYPHIDNVVLLSIEAASSGGDPVAASLRLTTAGGEWAEAVADLRSLDEVGVGPREGSLHVSPVAAGERRHWLAVLVLAGDGAGASGKDLVITGDGTAVAAVATAPSLPQLRFALSFIPGLYRGAPAVPGGEAVPWIVPPLCPTCRQVEPLPAAWRPGVEDTWRLALAVGEGGNAYVDPGGMSIGGRRLGAPLEMAWIPAGDPAAGWVVEGSGLIAGDLDPLQLRDPYLENGFNETDREPGELVFTFSGDEPGPGEFLVCTLLCGRSFVGEIDSPRPEPVVSAETVEKEGLEVSGRQPMLSPSLLETFPNPFRDQTRIRFRVPETIAEGFVWPDGDAPDIDAQARIPYSSSMPAVSLKVYTVAGHEIATIFSGSRSVGGYEVSWDGNDVFGRQVAAGTYFCKLQIENWSVTKRVTYLR